MQERVKIKKQVIDGTTDKSREVRARLHSHVLVWIVGLITTVALFYWKILFTKQFSILWEWETVNQSYAWHQFAAAAIQNGTLPIWDPHRFSGNTFIGEMQTGLFYPLKLFTYLMPFDVNGLVSERIYNQFYVATHMLAAIFMFFLARYLRLSSFSSFVAGLSFALGGFIARTGHPHVLDSANRRYASRSQCGPIERSRNPEKVPGDITSHGPVPPATPGEVRQQAISWLILQGWETDKVKSSNFEIRIS